MSSVAIDPNMILSAVSTALRVYGEVRTIRAEANAGKISGKEAAKRILAIEIEDSRELAEEGKARV